MIRPPHLHRDWAHPRHICTGTGLAPATAAPGLGSPPATSARGLRSLHATSASGTGLAPCHICTGTAEDSEQPMASVPDPPPSCASVGLIEVDVPRIESFLVGDARARTFRGSAECTHRLQPRLHEGPSARGSARAALPVKATDCGRRHARRPHAIGFLGFSFRQSSSFSPSFSFKPSECHTPFQRLLRLTLPVCYAALRCACTMELLRPFMDRTRYSRARRGSHAAAVDVTSTTFLGVCLRNGLPVLPPHFWISKTAAASANR